LYKLFIEMTKIILFVYFLILLINNDIKIKRKSISVTNDEESFSLIKIEDDNEKICCICLEYIDDKNSNNHITLKCHSKYYII
jgi:hypothetical protein